MVQKLFSEISALVQHICFVCYRPGTMGDFELKTVGCLPTKNFPNGGGPPHQRWQDRAERIMGRTVTGKLILADVNLWYVYLTNHLKCPPPAPVNTHSHTSILTLCFFCFFRTSKPSLMSPWGFISSHQSGLAASIWCFLLTQKGLHLPTNIHCGCNAK